MNQTQMLISVRELMVPYIVAVSNFAAPSKKQKKLIFLNLPLAKSRMLWYDKYR